MNPVSTIGPRFPNPPLTCDSGRVIKHLFWKELPVVDHDQSDSILNRTVLARHVVAVVYDDIWNSLDHQSGDGYVLEVGAGVGATIGFYPEDKQRKVIPLDSNNERLQVCKRKYASEHTLCRSFSTLNGEDRIHGVPVSSCLGTNSLYYAEDIRILEMFVRGIDDFLEFNPRTGKKTISHLFIGEPPGKRWGSISSVECGERVYENFGRHLVSDLEALGYRVRFGEESAKILLDKRAMTAFQRTALEKKEGNVLCINHDSSNVTECTEIAGRSIGEDEIVEQMDFHYLHAEKIA